MREFKEILEVENRKKRLSEAMKQRYFALLPIAKEKWIVRLVAKGITRLGRRKSPKKGHLFQIFGELVSIPNLIRNRNFSLEVLLIMEEEIRRDDGQGSRRRKEWSIANRRFLDVVSRHMFKK